VAHIQFIVLKRKGKLAVKFVDQERFFSSQREALHAAIERANDCGKDGKPSVVVLQKAKNKFDTIGKSAFPPSKSDVPALSEAS
jgi:hypothetical protein